MPPDRGHARAMLLRPAGLPTRATVTTPILLGRLLVLLVPGEGGCEANGRVMDEALERTIIAIHRSPRQCDRRRRHRKPGARVADRVPGASHTLLEARLPYARASLRDFLGQHAKHCVSAETATAMARWSLSRALELREGDVGTRRRLHRGAVTTRPRRGMHGIELAILSPGGVGSGARFTTRSAWRRAHARAARRRRRAACS